MRQLVKIMALTAIAAAGTQTPAYARGHWGHGWHGHHGHHGHRGVFFSFSTGSPYYYGRPYYYQPYPYYAQPVVIEQQPVVLAAETADPQGNRYCREYQSTVRVGGQAQRSYGTACMQPDGSWEIVD